MASKPRPADSPSGVDVRNLQSHGSFRLIAYRQLDIAPYIQVAKWQCQKTGLTVVWSDTPGPISHMRAIVRTEIFDSSGVPHTLEHLSFEGSRKYPQPGLLDAVANRLFANGTNAETDVDHTMYTCDSASAEGLLKIMIVYLDHLFFPLLDENCFLTEVFHINGKGEEGGTVFSEMQGREGSQGDVMDLTLRRILYNKRNAYRSETGGQLSALRRLTLQQIEDYHAAMYVPQNMTLVVTGHTLRPQDLLDTIATDTLPDLIKFGHRLGPRPHDFVRPLVESSTAQNPPMLTHDISETVTYADSNESVGVVQIAWVGPSYHDWRTLSALTALGWYLSSGSASPLAQEFVESKNPACSGVGFSTDMRDPIILSFTLSSVVATRLWTLGSDFLVTLDRLCSGRFDMKRMQARLQEWRLDVLHDLEASSDNVIINAVSDDALYGEEGDTTFSEQWNDMLAIDELLHWKEKDWRNLMATWFIDSHCVTLTGTPSSDMATEQAEATKARIKATCQQLGNAGLASLEKRLSAAKQITTQPVPAALLSSFSPPDAAKIVLAQSEVARSKGTGGGQLSPFKSLQSTINKDTANLPYFLQFNHYASSFVSISAYLNGPITDAWPLFVASFFAMPVQRAHGEKLSYQDAYRQLDDLTVSFSAATCSEGLFLSIQVPKDKYEEAVAWLADTIYGTTFDPERLSQIVEKELRALPASLEDPMSMAATATRQLSVVPHSITFTLTAPAKAKLYRAYQQQLKRSPKGLVADLLKQRQLVTGQASLRFSVAGDVKSLPRPVEAWVEHFPPGKQLKAKDLARLPRVRDTLTPLGSKPAKKGILFTMAATQSTFLCARARGVAFGDADCSAIEVATACLSASNSFLWNACRGPGLCYGLDIALNLETEQLVLMIWESPDVYVAWKAARECIESIASGKTVITDADLVTAKSNLIFGHADVLSTAASAADESFASRVILGRPANYDRVAMQALQKVTLVDVLTAIRKWILPLFASDSSIIGISSGPAKADEMYRKFSRQGYDLQRCQTSS
ncbi:hypothetical protein JCM10908_004050 [Rhodotorula pacifica]|uniref:uncharacterized protein n=1 Tax=Rhodotorula pacifica TaxID=1495444 RepID=UPI003176AD45